MTSINDETFISITYQYDIGELLSQVRQDDLLKFGIIPELIGRLPVKAGSGLTRVGVLEAPLEELNWLDKGTRLGPGKGVTLNKPTRVAVVDVGWFNGIGTFRPSDRVEPILVGRLKAGRARKAAFSPVFRVNGKKARVLGQVGMCSLVLDVTRCNPNPGDVATLEVDPRYIRGVAIQMTE